MWREGVDLGLPIKGTFKQSSTLPCSLLFTVVRAAAQ